MTLQSSGSISLQQIATEFGGATTNITLQNYYAGGPNVPAGTLNGSSVAIPSSGAVKLQDYYGASNRTYAINGGNYNIYSQGAPGGSSSVSIHFDRTGALSVGGSGSVIAHQYSGPSNWATPNATGLGSGYEFIINSASHSVTATSSSFPTVGTWTNMGSDIDLSISNTGNRGFDYSFACQIRTTPGNVVVASFTIDLQLENT